MRPRAATFRVLGAVLVGLAGGVTPACLLSLDNEIACGDGFVDRNAGEDCDPGVPASFADACGALFGVSAAHRRASCDPLTCTLDVSECALRCGNGTRDAGEECDASAPPQGPGSDGLGIDGVSCVELHPLDSGSEYAGGTARVCTESCLWDRTPCHRCGDNQLQADELCDGEFDDFDAVDAFCLGACIAPGQHPRPSRVTCAARCASNCQSYEPSDTGLGCCIPNGDPVDPLLPCCGFADAGTCRPGLGG